jgi:hypothetical protein
MKVYLFGTSYDIDSSERLADEFVSENTYGYYIFAGLFSGFFLINNSIKSLFILLILIVASFHLIMLNASRGSLIIFTILISFNIMIFLSLSKNKNLFIKTFLFLIVTAILIAGAIYVYIYIIEDSYINARFLSLEDRVSTREYHFYKAIEIGLQYPFLGVGGGNYAVIPKDIELGSFSHCSYVEAFANYGVMGLILLLTCYYDFFRSIFRMKNVQRKDKINKYLSLSFFIVFLVYNFFYVTYLNIVFMGIYVNVLAHVKIENTIFIKK